MLRKLLSLQEPDRTIQLEAVSVAMAFKVYSDKEFKTRFCGKIETVKKGENLCSKSFALHLLDKYPELTEDPIANDVKTTPETYEKKLISVTNIGPAIAKKIMAEYPTAVELMEAVKSDRLPEDWAKFKAGLKEVFEK